MKTRTLQSPVKSKSCPITSTEVYRKVLRPTYPALHGSKLSSSVLSFKRTADKLHNLTCPTVGLPKPWQTKVKNCQLIYDNEWDVLTRENLQEEAKFLNASEPDEEKAESLSYLLPLHWMNSIDFEGQLVRNQDKTKLASKAGLTLFEAHVLDLTGRKVPVKVMYDTGASTNFMSHKLLKRCNLQTVYDPENMMSIKVADGKVHRSCKTVNTVLSHQDSGYQQLT